MAVCELLILSVPKVLEVLHKHPRLAKLNYYYGCAVAAQFDNEESSCDLDTKIDHELVLMLMPKPERLLIMEPLLSMLEHKTEKAFRFRNTKGFEQLQQELQAGKCILTLAP